MSKKKEFNGFFLKNKNIKIIESMIVCPDIFFFSHAHTSLRSESYAWNYKRLICKTLNTTLYALNRDIK